MPFLLGTVASQKTVLNSYELISTTILGTATATFTISSIPSTYKHLQLRMVTRGDDGNSSVPVFININGDTGFNYASHALAGLSGATNSSSRIALDTAVYIMGASDGATTGDYAPNIVDILDYTNTNKYKTVKSLGGQTVNTGIILRSNLWLNTAAITSMTFKNSGTLSFMAGSRFSLYGIKG
jgi:hypothetical protein